MCASFLKLSCHFFQIRRHATIEETKQNALNHKTRFEVKTPYSRRPEENLIYLELFNLDYIEEVHENEQLTVFSNGQEAVSFILTINDKKVTVHSLKKDLANKFRNDIGQEPPFMSVGKVKGNNFVPPQGGYRETMHLSGGGTSSKSQSAAGEGSGTAKNENPQTKEKKSRGRPAKKISKNEGGAVIKEDNDKKKKTASSASSKEIAEMKKAVASVAEEKERGRKRTASSGSSSSCRSSSAASSTSGRSRSGSASSAASADESPQNKERVASALYGDDGDAVNYDSQNSKNTLK